MKTASRISKVLHNQSDCLLMASRIYEKHFKPTISETAYYQTLSRMCKRNELIRLAPGIYCIPKKSKLGLLPPSEKDIVNYFTGNERGVIIGLSLYNSAGITKQDPKTIHLLSSQITDKKLRINNILVERLGIRFTEERRIIIRMFDILCNYKKIENININSFFYFCELFAENYNEIQTELLIEQIGYPKWTIAFLAEILDYLNVDHSLSTYISPLSKYNIPDFADLFNGITLNNGG